MSEHVTHTELQSKLGTLDEKVENVTKKLDEAITAMNNYVMHGAKAPQNSGNSANGGVPNAGKPTASATTVSVESAAEERFRKFIALGHQDPNTVGIDARQRDRDVDAAYAEFSAIFTDGVLARAAAMQRDPQLMAKLDPRVAADTGAVLLQHKANRLIEQLKAIGFLLGGAYFCDVFLTGGMWLVFVRCASMLAGYAVYKIIKLNLLDIPDLRPCVGVTYAKT